MSERVEIVAFSGGADSTALALLHPNATVIFTDTGWEFPELYEHIERFEDKTGRQVVRIMGVSLPDIIRERRFFPSFKARFCTREAKILPMNKYLKAVGECDLMIGLRADEEGRAGNLSNLVNVRYRYPLRERGMARVDVIRVCLEHDLLPRYPVYMARGGCVGCFYKRKSEIAAMAVLAPDELEELQKLEEEIQDERREYYYMFPNLGMSIAQFRRQLPLFDVSSLYREMAGGDDVVTSCGVLCHR